MRTIMVTWFRFTYWLKWKLPWNAAKERRMAQEWRETMEATKHIRCSCCKRSFDINDSGWRFLGNYWEHKCPENDTQAGYFLQETIPTS